MKQIRLFTLSYLGKIRVNYPITGALGVLALILVMLVGAARSQSKDLHNSNSVDLSGEWYEAPKYPGPILGDGAAVIVQVTYIFGGSAKVTQVNTVTKSAFRQMGLNYRTGLMYCCDLIPAAITQYPKIGTYKISGNSIVVEFSDTLRTGTIGKDLIKGVRQVKTTGEKDEWIIARAKTSDQASSQQSSGRVADDPPIDPAVLRQLYPQQSNLGSVSGNSPIDSAVERQLFEKSRPSECLPKQGTLVIKMKDGSMKTINLSEAETITVVP